MLTTKKRVFLTGASSGIGSALAVELAGRGYDLVLAARRTENLVTLKAQIAELHPLCETTLCTLDVTRYDDVQAAINAAAQEPGGLDMVIVNAGLGSTTALIGSGQFQRDRAVIETNLIGAMAAMDAAVSLFRAQNRGHIVVVSSVAAFRGLPYSASYSASKAAIAVYADAARVELHGTPVCITTLFPGFIDTPLNRDGKGRPFMISVTRGVRIIADLIERRVQRSTVPVWPWTLIRRILQVMPTRLLARSVKGMPGGE